MTAADDFTPTDGISDFFVLFEGLDQVPNTGDAVLRFRIIRKSGGQEEHQATLAFPVRKLGDGLSGLMTRGYDDLINALRQMIFCADAVRQAYRKEADLLREAKERPSS